MTIYWLIGEFYFAMVGKDIQIYSELSSFIDSIFTGNNNNNFINVNCPELFLFCALKSIFVEIYISNIYHVNTDIAAIR